MCFTVIIIISTTTTTKTSYNCITIVTSIYSVEILCRSNTLNDCVSGETETSGRTAQPKVSLDSFHPIRILGEGGFGKVILAKKKSPDGYDQRFAIKVMKKSHIISCCSVTCTVSEKEALVLASGHPFITTLYSCFQTKVIFNFLKLLHISRESLILKCTIRMKMLCSGAFAKLQKWVMSFTMSAWPFICQSVCLSVCLSVWNNSAPTGRIFIKFRIIKFNENLSKICQNNSSFTKVW